MSNNKSNDIAKQFQQAQEEFDDLIELSKKRKSSNSLDNIESKIEIIEDAEQKDENAKTHIEKEEVISEPKAEEKKEKIKVGNPRKLDNSDTTTKRKTTKKAVKNEIVVEDTKDNTKGDTKDNTKDNLAKNIEEASKHDEITTIEDNINILESEETKKELEKQYAFGHYDEDSVEEPNSEEDALTEEIKKDYERDSFEVFDDMKKDTSSGIVLEDETITNTKKEPPKQEKINTDSKDYDHPIVLTSDNPFIEELESFTPDLDKILIKDSDMSDPKEVEVLNQYINPKKSPIVMPRVVKVPLLLSGYSADIRAYSNNDLFAVNRTNHDETLPYSARMRKEIESLWEHISWDSKGYYNDFNKFIKNTFIEDIDMLYFGAKDATYPGAATYNITCSCGHEFTVTKKNHDLHVLVQRGLKPQDIKDILLNENSENSNLYEKLSIRKEAQSDIKKMLSNKTIVELGLCTIERYLEWLTVLEGLFGTSGSEYPDISSIEDPSSKGHIYYKMFTYIKRLSLPTIVGKTPKGQNIIGYRGINCTVDNAEVRVANMYRTASFISSMHTDALVEILTGKDIRAMWSIRGIKHRIADIVCPNPECKAELVIPLNIRDHFFGEAERTSKIFLMA